MKKTTILIVTHDLIIVKRHPKRRIILQNGYIKGDIDKEFKNELF